MKAMTIGTVVVGLFAAYALTEEASAGPCVTAAYSTYLTAGFSCTVADKTFSSFSFGSTAGGSGVALTPADLSASPEISSDGPGLLFSSGAISISQPTASTTLSFVDVTLDFTVTTSGSSIHDADLVIAGGTTGGGIARTDETVTPGGALHVALPTTSDLITFAPVSSVDVLKDILVEIPIGAIGTANITAVSQQFSEVPEPATLALLGVGLLGLSVARRSRRI